MSTSSFEYGRQRFGHGRGISRDFRPWHGISETQVHGPCPKFELFVNDLRKVDESSTRRRNPDLPWGNREKRYGFGIRTTPGDPHRRFRMSGWRSGPVGFHSRSPCLSCDGRPNWVWFIVEEVFPLRTIHLPKYSPWVLYVYQKLRPMTLKERYKNVFLVITK